MLNWIRKKLSKHIETSIPGPSTCIEVETALPKQENNMQTEPSLSKDPNKTLLKIIFEGDVWIVKVDGHQLLSDLLNLALGHFLDPIEPLKFTPTYKLVRTSMRKVLNPLHTVEEEELRNEDEILLVSTVTTGAAVGTKLTLQDVKGPTKEEIMLVTALIAKKNAIPLVPAMDCQENYQSEIRKVLYSLVEASAKILSQSPDAKVIFDEINTRISAKSKKEIDKNSIKYLKDMGFTEPQARYALRLKRNRQVEALEWLLENSHRVKDDMVEDEKASAEVASTTTAGTSTSDPIHLINKLLGDIRNFHISHFEPNSKALESLKAMGFSEDAAIEALKHTANNPVAASEWLCGERDPTLVNSDPGLDTNGPLYKALMNNPAIQLGLQNPKIMLAFLSILENPASASMWLNDVDTAPVLGQVFKTYHSEKHIMFVRQQLELARRQDRQA